MQSIDTGNNAKGGASLPSVLFVVNFLGGSARWLTSFLRSPEAKRYRVTLLVVKGGGPPPEEIPAGVAIVSGDYHSSIPRKIAGTILIARLSRKHDFIVAWDEYSTAYMTIVGALMAFRRPVGFARNHVSAILRYRQAPSFHRQLIPVLYPLFRKMIACSNGVAEDLRDHFGLTRVVYLPVAIDIERIRTMASEKMPGKFKDLFARPVLITVGGLNFQKAHEILIRAFARIVEAGYPHDLVVLGEGTARASLALLVAELRLTGRVHLPGYTDNLFPLIRQSEMFVLSSRYEGLPSVLLEAMALGVPIVSTDCCGGPGEILAKGRCGLLVPPDNPLELARGITALLENRALAEQLRLAGSREIARLDLKCFSHAFIEAIVSR